MVIGSLPVWEHAGQFKILLCKRAIEPRHGYWTLPAGFMENAETTAEAAIRETEEEAGANIELGPLFSLLNVAHVHQVHLFYLARLLDLDFAPGIESLEVELFSEEDIPWDDLGFPHHPHDAGTVFRRPRPRPRDGSAVRRAHAGHRASDAGAARA